MSECRIELSGPQRDHDEARSTGADLEAARHSPSTDKKDPPNKQYSTDGKESTDADAFAADAVPDPNLVDWEGPDDPANPRNWSKARKMFIIALVSLSVLYSYVWTTLFPVCLCKCDSSHFGGNHLLTQATERRNIATTMFAPGASALEAEFGVTSSVVATLTVTIPSLGASLGPLLFAPLSEIAGRLPMYWASSILYLGFTVGCARSTDVAMFLVFRFLGGACAASFIALGGGTIADLLPKEERGAATAMFTAGPLLGPVIGPIVGGFVTQALGWRWTFYLVLILVSVALHSSLFPF